MIPFPNFNFNLLFIRNQFYHLELINFNLLQIYFIATATIITELLNLFDLDLD